MDLSIRDWKYVPTKENPSDLGTRGVKQKGCQGFGMRDQVG